MDAVQHVAPVPIGRARSSGGETRRQGALPPVRVGSPSPRAMPSPLLRPTITGAGPQTLVLANGLGTNQHTWRHVARAVEPHARVVRFDYVGTPHGDLAAYGPARYETLHDHADDVLELLDALDLRDAAWVGHSVSGMIGVLAAVAAPERIGRLVLVSASPRYLDDADGYRGGFDRAAIDRLLAAAGSDYHAWVGGFSPLAIGAAHCPDAVEEFGSYLRRMRPDVALRTLRAVFLSDHRAALPRVTQPVTVVQPRADVAVPTAVGRYLAATIPRAAYVELAAEGHVPQLTAPDELIAALDAALGLGIAAATRATAA